MITPVANVTPAPAPVRRTAVAPVASVVARPWLATQKPPAPTLDAALDELQGLVQRLEAAHDRRVVFAATYWMQIRGLADDIQRPGRYDDPTWMTQVTLDFMRRYMDAFEAYDRGDRASVPAAWLAAFDAARSGKEPVIEDLMLSMNAHINHDLPLSLAAVGPGRQHLADYRRFNDVLCHNVGAVLALMERQFLSGGSLEARTDQALGGRETAIAGHLIVGWREAAWKNATAIATRGQAAYPQILRRASWRTRLYQGLGALVPAPLVRRGLL